MPQVRKTGTAWECSLDDYAYTRGLDPTGWAWEFLRRNEAYQRDVRINRAGHPAPIKHASGAIVLRLRRRVLAAEKWGLQCFADPQKSAHEAHVFWIADHLHNSVSCTLRVANDNDLSALNLASFGGQRRVLVTPKDELVVIAENRISACMVVRNATFLIGKSAVSFEILGLDNPSTTIEVVNNLRRLRSNEVSENDQRCEYRSKYLDYLVALDGHLAGLSYREIAIVLYSAERIGPYWTDDSRGYKSKVRRAVERGLALMNGGYRELL